jgi:hypothetical protein
MRQANFTLCSELMVPPGHAGAAKLPMSNQGNETRMSATKESEPDKTWSPTRAMPCPRAASWSLRPQVWGSTTPTCRTPHRYPQELGSADGHRVGPGNHSRASGAYFRAFLHHQRGRQGHRSGPGHPLRHCETERPVHLGIQRARPGSDLQPGPQPCLTVEDCLRGSETILLRKMRARSGSPPASFSACMATSSWKQTMERERWPSQGGTTVPSI